MTYQKLLTAVSASALIAAVILPASAQDTSVIPETEESERTLDTVVSIGTRVANRTALDTAVAVDVVTADSLQKIGIGELNQALSVQLPSFNFPRPALNDGTDSVRPAGLRGLGPDQTLVLVNGKRRHSAALVNVNGSIGRGTSAVDLNTIPTYATSGIEVLRDGASAQYGSDAIAGVINVKLREADSGGGAQVSYGWRETEYTVPLGTVNPAFGLNVTGNTISRERSDGHVVTLSGWKGLQLGETGFLTITGEVKDQQHTERSGFDVRPNYTNAGTDPREAVINRFNAWTGEPELEQLTFFANGGYDLANGVELYGWASYQDRDTISAGFFRRALDARNVVEIYPNGFLPKIAPETTDYSLAGGARFLVGEWDMDASLVFGSNKMDFQIIDTLNRSIGPSSKTSFAAGGFEHTQLVANLSAVRGYDVEGLASPLNVAWGVEARREGYEIFAGEPDSFRNGGVLLGGTPTASGAQVFPGFRPANEVDDDRTAVGAYVDLEANLTDKFLLSGAVRVESYSDFGETITGKVAARYDFTESFALRGSVQNGFRAPSLQQQNFATTSTNFINGVPFDITTFPVTDPVAIALGAKPLDAEDSINFSIGSVIRAGGLNVTIDAYRIDVNDRIVLSENLTQANVRAFLVTQGFIGSGGGRFFVNGVDTETMGIDIVTSYTFPETGFGQFDTTLGANFNQTEVTKVPEIPTLTALNPAPVLFDRGNLLAFEEGTPKNKFTGSLNWTHGVFGATVRAIHYGDVLSGSNTPGNDYTLEAKTLLDLEARYTFREMVTLSLGADNVFDEYATPAPIDQNGTGNTPFSGFNPFGNSGRFVYMKAAIDF